MAKSNTTQDFVPIREIRNGVLILKDGSLRSVLMVSSMNFGLKSDDEKKAILFEYQNFLNALDFPTQISVQSRKLDIRPYLLLLENRIKVQSEPLIKLQTKEYIEFIRNFTESVAIMTKSFFIVIPYSHTVFKSDSGILGRLFSKKSKQEAQALKQIDFEEKRSQLEERVAVIQQGLSRCGINSAQLDTEEVVEVFYKVFNPGELEGKIKIE